MWRGRSFLNKKWFTCKVPGFDAKVNCLQGGASPVSKQVWLLASAYGYFIAFYLFIFVFATYFATDFIQ